MVHVIEWLNLGVRWFHFITGVAWIGASFYFNWLENNLERKNQREELAGSLWAVHGGGFYYLEKYKVAPKKLPEKLHWFKYEAYFTWLSGFALLAIVYYTNAQLYLINPSNNVLSTWSAILISIFSLVGSWFFYDFLCKSPLGKHNGKVAAVGFLYATGLAYLFSQIYAPRAAFIHVGAVLGTCMVANVFFMIIPSQKALVNAAVKGEEPNGILGKKAFQRSLHNNYMTLPVLFIMISNHFPSTYSHSFNWVVLAGLSFGSALIRHWFNLRGRGEHNVWILPVAALCMVALAFVTRPQTTNTKEISANTLSSLNKKVDFSTAQKIIQTHCATCHSSAPTDNIFRTAPAGVKFDTPDLMKNWAAAIKQRALTLGDMPFGNKTNMTKEERETIGRWVDQGSHVN